MTSQELLSILGGVKNRYILDAQNLRSRTGSTHRLYWKRTITMLAAVIALITLLFGIAIAASTNFREYVFEIFGLFFSPKTKTIIIEEIISKFTKIPRAKDGASNALGIAMS